MFVRGRNGGARPMIAAIAAALVQPTPAGLTAAEIFAKARLAMYLHSYPRFVTYVIDVQSDAYGKHYHEGYNAALRTKDGARYKKLIDGLGIRK